MDLADCYRLLGLKSGASFEDVKAAYRRLARQLHPDVNPGNTRANDQFIQVTAAYKFLIANSRLSAEPKPPPTAPKVVIRKQSVKPVDPRPTPSTAASKTSIQFNSNLSAIDQQLKESSYQQLQSLLRSRKFPRAIALVEGLAQRIPHDPEVVQWQAIAYQRWGRQLIQERQLDKARIYLKKALRTDPHNRSLWAEVEKDFRYLEQLF